MAANQQNGYYSGDCGAPGAQPYNYHFANKDETSSSDQASSSHLSFLYDRAQGNSYTASPPPPPAAAAAKDPAASTASNRTQGRCISAETDNREKCGEWGEGVSCVTPAPSYPYTPSSQTNGRQHPSPEESMACPSGTTPSSFSSSSSSVDPQSNDFRRQESGHIGRQMSELKISQPRNCASVTSPSPQSSKGHEGNAFTGPRVNGSQGVVYKCPAATHHVDPRRNHVRQSIPWKDINSVRKFSVPINLSRSRVQMTEFSKDDQATKGRASNDPWSPPRPLAGEVDKTSVRQLLREGDEIGDYDQTSIRYKGRTNPSKSFRLLQSVTGSSDSLSIEHHQAERKERRRQKREEMLSSAAAAEGCCDGLRDADDVVDISYIGSKIPSRTFRSLQEAIGARDHQDRPLPSPSVGVLHNYSDCSPSFDLQPTRTVKVIHLRPQKSLENLIGDF